MFCPVCCVSVDPVQHSDHLVGGRESWLPCFCFWSMACVLITKIRLFKYIENFTANNWQFSDKNSDIFHVSAQNIDCGYSLEPPRGGGSNEYPQSMFLSRNKKNNVYPCKHQFYYLKVGLRGSRLYRHVFVMVCHGLFAILILAIRKLYSVIVASPGHLLYYIFKYRKFSIMAELFDRLLKCQT